MTRKAHDKIAAGLSDALAFAQGDETKGRIANAAKAAPRPLTPTQKRALLAFPATGNRSAYPGLRLPTLWALCKLGLIRKTTLPGAGALFSPTTAFRFALTATGKAAADAFRSIAPENSNRD